MKEFSLMNNLSAWLMRPKLGDDKPPSFYPSSAAAVGSDGKLYGTCRRRQFLDYLRTLYKYGRKADKYKQWQAIVEDTNKTLVPDSKYHIWIFQQGELFEEHCLKLITQSGLFIDTQTQVYVPEYNVSGRIDCIAFNPESHKNIIAEFKSVYGPNADTVLGTDWERTHGMIGEPRDYNLMQLAIYQWHFANARDNFEYGQLIYGDRGTGVYASYQVNVDEETKISYRGIDPVQTGWITVPYSVQDIMDTYKSLQVHLDEGKVPARDFDLSYSDEKLSKLVDESFWIFALDKDEKKVEPFFLDIEEFLEAGKTKKGRKFTLEPKTKGQESVSKTLAEAWLKYYDRQVNGGREVKRPEGGNYQCGFCKYRKFCYDSNKQPRNENISCLI